MANYVMLFYMYTVHAQYMHVALTKREGEEGGVTFNCDSLLYIVHTVHAHVV